MPAPLPSGDSWTIVATVSQGDDPRPRPPTLVDALLPEADVILGDWSHTLHVRDPGPRVSYVQMVSVGVDTVDVDRCAALGVPVANTAGANTVSVAEWCLSATLAQLRKTIDELKDTPTEELVEPLPRRVEENTPTPAITDAAGTEKWDEPGDEERTEV